MKYNTNLQFYKTIPLRLIERNYTNYNAKRYTVNDTNQNFWIPNKHLELDGTIKTSENIDYIFRGFHAVNKLNIAKVKLGGLKNE